MVSKIRFSFLGFIFIMASGQKFKPNRNVTPQKEIHYNKPSAPTLSSDFFTKKIDTIWLKLDTLQQIIKDQNKIISQLALKNNHKEPLSESTYLDTTTIPMTKVDISIDTSLNTIYCDIPVVKHKKSFFRSIFNFKL